MLRRVVQILCSSWTPFYRDKMRPAGSMLPEPAYQVMGGKSPHQIIISLYIVLLLSMMCRTECFQHEATAVLHGLCGCQTRRFVTTALSHDIAFGFSLLLLTHMFPFAHKHGVRVVFVTFQEINLEGLLASERR